MRWASRTAHQSASWKNEAWSQRSTRKSQSKWEPSATNVRAGVFEPEPRVWTLARRGSGNSSYTHHGVVFEPGGQEVILRASQCPATHTQGHWALDLGHG